jgi:hypothetical protein
MSGMFRPWMLPLAAVVVLLAGISGAEFPRARNRIPEGAKAILEQPDQFELLSLNPFRRTNSLKGSFHGYQVLGRAVITNAESRQKLISAFEKGVRENKGMENLCFDPRHGIHVTHDGKSADFVICFQCLQVLVYGPAEAHLLISRSPEPVFDKALRHAGIRLDK